MFKIKIADIVVQIDNKYSYVEEFCKNYLVINEEEQLTIRALQEEIEKEKEPLLLLGMDIMNPYVFIERLVNLS